MDEVYLDADEGEAKFGLPKIVLDDAGAPEVEEKANAPKTKLREPARQEKRPTPNHRPAAENSLPEPPLLTSQGIDRRHARMTKASYARCHAHVAWAVR